MKPILFLLAACATLPTSSDILAAGPEYITEWHQSDLGPTAPDLAGEVLLASDHGTLVFMCSRWTYGSAIALDQNGSILYTTTEAIGAIALTAYTDGTVYVVAYSPCCVTAFGPLGSALTSWNLYPASQRVLTLPTSARVDADGLVCVGTIDTVRVYESGGRYVRSVYLPGVSFGGFAVDESQDFFVVSGDQVVKYDSLGTSLFTIGGTGTEPGKFSSPSAPTIDPFGHLLVIDYYNDRIQIFDGAGNFLGLFGESGSLPGQFDRPVSMTIDGDARLYVSDMGNARIQIFQLSQDVPAQPTSWGQIKAHYH